MVKIKVVEPRGITALAAGKLVAAVLEGTISEQPPPGSALWRIEEALLYLSKEFRCHLCKRVVSADVGGADDMPDACDRCWNKVHGKRARAAAARASSPDAKPQG